MVEFYKSHIWCEVILWCCLAFFGVALLFESYLKQEYYQYLIEKNTLMETVVLDTVQENVKDALQGYIDTACEAAIAPEIYDAAQAVFPAKAHQTKMKDTLDMEKMLSKYSRYSGSILSMAVYNGDGEIYQYDKFHAKNEYMWNQHNIEYLEKTYEELMGNLKEGAVTKYVVSAEPGLHSVHTDQRVFHILCPVIGNNKDLKNIPAVLCVTYSMDVFRPFLETISKDGRSYVIGYITDQAGKIISHDNSDIIGMNENEYIKSERLSHMEKELGVFGWKLNIALDKEKVKDMINDIFNRAVIGYLFLIFLFQVLLYFIFKRTLSPIKKIKQVMDMAKEGEEKQKIKIEGTNELWQLAEHYNKMMAVVQYHHQEQLHALERQQQAEREALESQIDAHFISNTLGLISYEAIESGNNHIAHMIKSLSNILRYTFNQKSQKVYLYQELMWIKQYLYLQKERFEDVFDYDIICDEGVEEFPCCKLMFQPFVENAVLHGFADVESGGILEIRAMFEDGGLRLSISDNGRGIDQERAEIIERILRGKGGEKIEGSEKLGIGILDAVARMKLFYGERISMSMKTETGKGTSFEFFIKEEVAR